MKLISLLAECDGTLKDNLIVDKKGIPVAFITQNESLIIVNGDDGDQIFADDFLQEGEEAITISFRCLGRFFTKGATPTKQQMIDALESVDIMDYTTDSRITQTKCPGEGYVRLYADNWHRSASVLFRYEHLDYADSLYILMGVDDDQYFGCSFEMDQKLPKTIVGAYKALMPKHIRETPSENIRRQGEWFFIKLDGVPADYVGAEKTPYNNEEVAQQYILRSRNDSPESNNHVISAQRGIWLLNDTFKLNGGNKIPVFVDSEIDHNEHQTLHLSGSWWPVENTAIQSFSEMGVD